MELKLAILIVKFSDLKDCSYFFAVTQQKPPSHTFVFREGNDTAILLCPEDKVSFAKWHIEKVVSAGGLTKPSVAEANKTLIVP